MFFETPAISELEFGKSLRQFEQQIYTQPAEDINAALRKAEVNATLNQDQAWQGFKWKAEKPEAYIPVIESIILPDSKKPTPYGETFIRLTIQPSFVTREPVIVKEEIHIHEKTKTIYFLGRPVIAEEARQYLQGFNEKLLQENPALFHVRHALTGTHEHPIANWQMIRLINAERNSNVHELISKMSGINIYQQTIKQLTALQYQH